MWAPFNVWTESNSQDQHKSMVDMGCYNFMTGAAGFIQSIAYGFGGLRFREDGLHITPSVPKNASFIKFRGLKYMGATFDVEFLYGVIKTKPLQVWQLCLTSQSDK